MSVRFGIVGLGMGMNRSRQVLSTDGAELVAVCDLDEARLEKAKTELDCEGHTDYQEMCERDDLDYVWIMLPSGMHAKFGIQAAECGKNVVTTKPMDITIEACDALTAACDKNGVKLVIDFEERFRPINRKIKKAVDEGLLGDVILGEIRLKWWRGEGYFRGWHGTWKQDGGGSLANQGVHQLDLLQWFLGDVDHVSGHFGIYGGHEHREVETEDLLHAHVQFKSGSVGAILTTTTCPIVQQTQVQVHGVKGVVGTGPDVWAFVGDDEVDVEIEPGPRNSTEDCISVLREGTEPACSGAEGRKTVELFNAIYQSGREKREVSLPL
ncbi:Gfo/Idh/MocA family oxidoreductase [Candidatus Poribacteria bacterium]|jgi:UDP-N-acetyl-2-amino-2-deoxyglucuronate dehydrogenase|nr:Gfo/Idh/MocA family oxidoreductase [Candidatus Poribacteria bacterium]MBT5535287.1 Gfo/Idh/MocA family oxidoreductase [Candidatus Poribacteria bacterium]MBT7097650.1 Gfo/Idh/MocA family oxidoreductase [Candidatus Poribacteria bacterium]MBT7804741.1 Gfo/Idh/MocA family oxidoreductase [Candidatus Poribacteria bacterium]